MTLDYFDTEIPDEQWIHPTLRAVVASVVVQLSLPVVGVRFSIGRQLARQYLSTSCVQL